MKRVNYKNITKSDTFIDRYLRFMETQETPLAYDFWCACWLLSLALGREVIVPRPRAPVFMNLYALLVADSGVTRKSSAVRHATEIARKFIAELSKQQRMELIETKSTPEKLEARMHILTEEAGHAHLAISISELVTFLGRERYTVAMPGLLTDLYDCPSSRSGGGTLGRGTTEIKDVFVSFLSASTPTWLAKAINPDVVEGGFTSRCMFIVSESRKKRIAWPEARDDDNSWFVEELIKIRNRAHDIKQLELTPGALKAFTRWYNNKDESRDPFSASFESREDAHVLRLAGYLAVDDGSWAIDAIHIRRAVDVIAEVKRDGSSIFVGGVRGDRLLNGIDLLRTKLLEVGIDGIQHNMLYHAVKHYLKNDEFTAALDVMHELGMVDRFIVDNTGAGRKRTVWRATKLITSPGSMENLKAQIAH